MSRVMRKDKPIQWKLSLPTSLAAAVDLYFYDPVRGRPSYGERSKLVTMLLEHWLKKNTIKKGKRYD